jgi:hypothetical protein
LEEKADGKFKAPEGLFFLISSLALLLTFMLWHWDSTTGKWVLYDPTRGAQVTIKTPKLHHRPSAAKMMGDSRLATTNEMTKLVTPQYHGKDVYPAEV